MGAILLGCMYVLLGALALVVAYVVIRALVKAVPHFILISSEYLWHNLAVLGVSLIAVGRVALMFYLIL